MTAAAALHHTALSPSQPIDFGDRWVKRKFFLTVQSCVFVAYIHAVLPCSPHSRAIQVQLIRNLVGAGICTPTRRLRSHYTVTGPTRNNAPTQRRARRAHGVPVTRRQLFHALVYPWRCKSSCSSAAAASTLGLLGWRADGALTWVISR